MIYLVRHGQTELNSSHALQGRSDLPLNENGIREATETGKELAAKGITFDQVYSSPLQRAVRTAELIAPGIEVRVDERLIEMDYGPYEGMDLKSPAPEVLHFFSDFTNNPAPEGMEQLSSVVNRVGEFLEEIKSLPGNILISTHAIALKGALEYLTPESKGGWWPRTIGNCAVFAAEQKNGTIAKPEMLLGQQGRL